MVGHVISMTFPNTKPSRQLYFQPCLYRLNQRGSLEASSLVLFCVIKGQLYIWTWFSLGHFLLIFIIKLTAISLTEQGKFCSDCPSNKHSIVCIKSMYALDKSIFGKKKKKPIIFSSLIFLCVSKRIRHRHRDQSVMNYFSNGSLRDLLWNVLLDVFDMYFRLWTHSRPLIWNWWFLMVLISMNLSNCLCF